MSYRQPISIQATFTDPSGLLISKQFRSLNQASKFFSVNIHTLKELSLGGTAPKNDKIPSDLKLVQIPTLPKEQKEPDQLLKDGKWFCQLCSRAIKPTSKYAHCLSAGHIKNKANSEQQEITTATVTKAPQTTT